MIYRSGEDFPFYTFEMLSRCSGIRHFVSSGCRTLGFSGEVDPETVRENRKLLASVVGFDSRKWVTGQQVHSTHVAVVSAADAGKGGLDRESRLPETDALVTGEKGICVMVLSADCVPVLFYDGIAGVVAAAHAGWKGTAGRIAAGTVEVMCREFGCRPEHIRAGIGPSIGKCCFEVGEEVAEVFRGLYPATVFPGRKPGKFQVDLWETNRLELLDAGLTEDHIEVAGLCSYCHPDRFFSYRRQGREAGRFGAGILMV